MNKKKVSLIMASIALITILTGCEFIFPIYVPSWMQGTWEDKNMYELSIQNDDANIVKSFHEGSYNLQCDSWNYILSIYEGDDVSNKSTIGANTIDQDVFNFVKKYSDITTDYSNEYMANSQVTAYTFRKQNLSNITNNYSYENEDNKTVAVSYSLDLGFTLFPYDSSKMYLIIFMESTVTVEGENTVTYNYRFNEYTGLPVLEAN